MPRRALASAFAVAALAALALVAPWDRDGPGAVERALAAVGDGPVVHALVRYSDGTRVEVATGRERRATKEVEMWLDEPRKTVTAVERRDGIVLGTTQGSTDALREGAFEQLFDPFQVASLYRRELEAGTLRVIAEGELLGRPVQWLARGEELGGFRAAIDAQTGRLLALRAVRDGKLAWQMDVLTMEAVERVPAAVDARARPLDEDAGTSSTMSSMDISLNQARVALASPAVWAGGEVAGRRVTAVQTGSMEVEGARRGFVSTTFVQLDYGSRWSVTPLGFLELVQSVAREAAPVWRAEGATAPPRAYLDLKETEVGAKGGVRKRWRARLRWGGLYVSIESWSREAVLEAARRLTPIPARPSGSDPDRVRAEPFPSGGIGEP